MTDQTAPTKVRVLAGHDINRHVLDVTLITDDGTLYEATNDGIDYNNPIEVTDERGIIRGWPGMQHAHSVHLDNGWDIPVRALRRVFAK